MRRPVVHPLPHNVSPNDPSSLEARPENPFLIDVCSAPFSVEERHSVNAMHREVLGRVGDAIEDLGEREGASRTGRPLLLLTAPRAGYGKTHLLGRVAAHAQGRAVAMPVIFRPDTEVAWSSVSAEAMEALRLLETNADGWSKLREICAGVFSSLVSRLVREGRLPCANAEQALKVLSGDPKELFREGHGARIIGEWLRKNFGLLRKPLADTARAVPGATHMDAWVEALFACALHGTPASVEGVVQLATASRPSFLLWLNLVAMWRPVVLFVDHLDGFYRHEQAGLKIATMVLELASIDGLHVVLSINQDLWQATFAHHLPSALEDRLTASQFLLRGLAPEDAEALITLRLREHQVPEVEGAAFLTFLQTSRYFVGRPVGSVSARAFLRHAALQWDVYQGMRAQGEDPNAPIYEAPPPAASSESIPPETSEQDAPLTMFPSIDAEAMQKIAGGLIEPRPAMMSRPFAASPLGASEGGSTQREPQPAPAPQPLLLDSPAALDQPKQPTGPGAMEKLREMMDRLRQVPAVNTAAKPSLPAPSIPANAGPITAAMTGGSNGVAARLATVMTAGTSSAQERFDELRAQVATDAMHRPLDLAKVTDIVRLAGKRFPLVRYDETPLGTTADRKLSRWTLPGLEILFGLGSFNDTGYWRNVSEFAEGRLSTLSQDAANNASPPVRLKLVVPKTDIDSLGWTGLLSGSAIAPALHPHIEALHLDGRSLASLYATRQLITEAESGTLSVSPSHLMNVVTRELDFFWKRVTRAPM